MSRYARGSRYVQCNEEGMRRLIVEQSRSHTPKSAVREFVTNSLDAPVQNKRLDISVVINPLDRRIIISDNGSGMSYEKLAERSDKIGDSPKYGKIDKRGEKALGLLAFGSLGEAMHIISRDYQSNDQGYGYVLWEVRKDGVVVADGPEIINPQKVESLFYGNFPNGTRIVIDRVNPHILEKMLTPAGLKEWLEHLYAPALNKGIANISVGKIDKKNKNVRTQALDVPSYRRDSSSELMDDVIPIRIKGQAELGNLEVILFVDPSAAYDKVAIYSKDVLVYDSVAELAEFNRSPVWTSGKVSGYINDHFNKLILGRDGIDRQRNSFKAWYEAVKEIEERIKPIVEEKMKHGKKMQEDAYIKKAFDAVSDVLKDLKKIENDNERYARSQDGEEVPVTGVEPTEIRGAGNRGHYDGPKKIGNGHPGPGTFKRDLDGVTEKVVQRQGLPFACAQPKDFPLSDRHLRSKLEDNMANPMLFINSAHEDYKSREEQKGSDFIRYALDLIAKEAAYYEMRKSEKEKKLFGDKVELVSAALQRAETIKFLGLRRLGIK